MVQMNLLAEQKYRQRCRELTYGYQGGKGTGMNWETGIDLYTLYKGLPGGASGKEPAPQCKEQKRHTSDPWVGKIRWRRKWQPTPVFLPGEAHGQRSQVDYSVYGHKESDMSEAT